MPSDVARGLPGAGGMADMDGISQVEMLDDGSSVGRIVIHVVTVADLARPAMPTPIKGDGAISLAEKEEHLRVPIVGSQWPAVVEDDRLSVLWPPILVEDASLVLGGHVAHRGPPFVGRRRLVLRAEIVGSASRCAATPIAIASRRRGCMVRSIPKTEMLFPSPPPNHRTRPMRERSLLGVQEARPVGLLSAGTLTGGRTNPTSVVLLSSAASAS